MNGLSLKPGVFPVCAKTLVGKLREGESFAISG